LFIYLLQEVQNFVTIREFLEQKRIFSYFLSRFVQEKTFFGPKKRIY